MKVGDLVKGRAKDSDILWMVLIAHKDDSSIYGRLPPKACYSVLWADGKTTNEWFSYLEVINEGR